MGVGKKVSDQRRWVIGELSVGCWVLNCSVGVRVVYLTRVNPGEDLGEAGVRRRERILKSEEWEWGDFTSI